MAPTVLASRPSLSETSPSESTFKNGGADHPQGEEHLPIGNSHGIEPAEPFFENPLQWTPEVVVADGTPHNIILRALGTDNELETKRLLQLFAEHFGAGYSAAGYSFDGVFDLEYWQRLLRSIDIPLVSIAAEEGGEMIAHLGLHYDNDRKRIELVYPAIHPTYASELNTISNLYWKKLEHLALRQQWRCLYQYSLASESSLQEICSRYLHTFETALIPGVGAEPGSIDSGNAVGVVLVYHLFEQAKVVTGEGESPNSVIDLESDAETVFLPRRHAEKIQELYAPLNLHRRFASPGKNPKKKDASLPAFGKCSRSVTLKNRFHLEQLSIFPSAFESTATALQEITRSTTRSTLLQISLTDPQTPNLCDLLEEQGWGFCGIQPLSCGTDFVLYANYSGEAVERASCSSPGAKALQNYLAQHGSSRYRV